MHPTRAIIHLENLRFNIAEIRKKVGQDIRICVPVKADAYGHGALKIAVAAIRSGATHLAVASAQEGVALREAGIVAPILSFSIPIPEEIPALIGHDIVPFIFDMEYIDEFSRQAAAMNRVVPVHLKIDTGMGRIGCTPEDAPALARRIARDKHLKLEGIATHLAVADSNAPEDVRYTHEQIARFSSAVQAIKAEGIDPGIVHAANSGAVIAYPEAWFDMVRPGILVYGYLPTPDFKGLIETRPVMELETQVVSIKKVSAGTSVSYGRTWVAEECTYIATLPVGYADGLLRGLSPGLRVRIGEREYPIVGRICMDQCMVNVGPDPWVQRWDRATVFGPAPAASSAETLARILGTIPYEITCGINKRVPRVYVGDEARH
ncbi:MAG TPA: alanine racemase [Treponemataceae bacterium]|nr:alanine racemase [Treponemataceae bacterium]HPS44147.1 alanine racemase [Treponemataceae bacterium]